MKRESKITVGDHRSNARIWLQGKWLVKFGFVRGAHWLVDYGQDQITIRTADAGRIISGKGDVPVLDINSAQLTAVFKAGEAVDVIATAGKIVIRKQL